MSPQAFRSGHYYPLESGQLVAGSVDLLGFGVDPVLQLQLGGEVTQQGHQILIVAGLDPTHLLLLLCLHTHTHTQGGGRRNKEIGLLRRLGYALNKE